MGFLSSTTRGETAEIGSWSSLVAAAVAKPRLANKRTSSNGSVERSACTTKQMTSAMPARSAVSGSGAVSVPLFPTSARPQSDSDPAGKEDGPDDVETLVPPAGDARKQLDREEEGHGRDRQVDEEDPAPAGGVDECAANDRAEDRRQQHGHADEAHGPAHPPWPGGWPPGDYAEKR
jgi:hypothetical protein